MSRAALAKRPRQGDAAHAREARLQAQRTRVLLATAAAVHAVGYRHLTIAKIVERARVSRRTFYDVFDDRDECFSAVFEQASDDARQRMLAAHARGGNWRESTRLALAELLVMLDEQPELATLCLVEASGASEAVLHLRAGVIAELAAAVDAGRAAIPRGQPQPPHSTAEAIVGAGFGMLHAHLLKAERRSTLELLGPLMSIVVLPYCGATAAHAELTQKPPAQTTTVAAPVAAGHHRELLADTPVRLTYRTMRTIVAIGEHPGASNLLVARTAEIADQGQVSKLLSRLRKHRLVENRGAGQPKGAANEWHLTPRGVELERTARATIAGTGIVGHR